MIQECSVERNSQNKQLNVEYAPSFPLCAYYNDMDHFAAKQVPWHWHEEIELIYVVEGEVIVHVYQQQLRLSQGDGLLINADALHQVEKAKVEETILYSFVFSHRMLSAGEDSVFETKYLWPFMHSKELAYHKFDHRNAEESKLAQELYQAYLVCQKEVYGYEFIIREKLTRILLFVLASHQEQLNETGKPEGEEVSRLKQMMAYLQQHYMEPIRLTHLAKHANISEREVLRCFQDNLKESPMQVLIKYRTMKACELLGTSNATISEIALACGFSDASYFAKLFKRLLAMSPSDYRKMMK